jgi:hypothetical protein
MAQSRNHPTKVFLSSTSNDLSEFRTAAADAITQRDMLPIMMERFPAVSRDAVEECEARVAEADLFVGVYANRYGYQPRNGERSITEMEYRWAEQHGIDRLIFVFDQGTRTLPPDHPVYRHADRNPKMGEFLEYVGKGVVWKKFASPDDLALQVHRSLEAWQNGPAYRKWFRSPTEMPPCAGCASVVLLAAMAVLLGTALVQLFRAGQETIGLLGAFLGLTSTAVALMAFYLKRIGAALSGLPWVSRLKPWALMLLLQTGLIVILVLGKPPVFNVLADDLIDRALAADNLSQADHLLTSADILGGNVPPRLERELMTALAAPNLPGEDEHALLLARLYRDHAPADRLQAQALVVRDEAQAAAAAGEGVQVKREVQVLAVLDAPEAGALARDFYDKALAAYVAQPPQTTAALIYLDAVLAVDELVETGLNRAEISYTYYLQGLVLALNSAPMAALDAYRQALAVDDTNLEARYALASTLLIQVENGGDPALLNEAVEVARIGHQEYIDQIYCRGTHDLSDPRVFRNVWNCFILMTTEAGARFLRAGNEDTLTTMRSLLDRAISLAEANDQFGEGYFTAEAYYWLARATLPDPSTHEGLALYCAIIQQHDSSKPRHRQWAAFANEQLNGRFCF